MALITLNENAPEGDRWFGFGNASIEVIEVGGTETDDYEVISGARQHPWLDVTETVTEEGSDEVVPQIAGTPEDNPAEHIADTHGFGSDDDGEAY